MDKEKNGADEMPAEIREAVRSVDLPAVCSGLGAALSLTPGQQAILHDSLASFLENVWNDKSAPLDMSAIKPLNEGEERILARGINEKVFLKIIRRLEELGLNDSDALFASGDIRLTAHKLHVGKYASHETDRIIYKKTECRRSGIFSKKSRFFIHLEADYPDQGRWGDYVPIRVRVDAEEEADAFLRQLNKAVNVGNFMNFHGIFSRFKLAR